MISNNLLNYIRIQQAQGFSYNEIESFLRKNGYEDTIIKEHFAQLMPQHKPLRPVLIVIGVLCLLVIGGGIVFASWFFSQPVCGNGVLEEGENPETCCSDAGCFGDENCVNNQCLAPTCGDCQYLAGNQCVDYECCDDSVCEEGFSCQDNRCREVICGFCQFVDGNSCTSYECCEDSMCPTGQICEDQTCKVGVRETTQECFYGCCDDAVCDDGDPNTFDYCQDASTLNAQCIST